MRFTKLRTSVAIAIMVSLLIMGVRPLIFHSDAARLPNRSVTLTDPRPGATTDYKFNFDLPATSTIGSIRFQFCSDTPLIDQPCVAPNGFIGSGSSLVSQQGVSGFTMIPAAVDNVITITRTAGAVTSGSLSFTFQDVISPTSSGTYYVRVQTYATEDATGASTDDGGLAFPINDAIDISTTVPPYLLLCNGITITGYDCSTASGDYINFGELSNNATKSAKTEMVVATNAANGYNLWVDGNTLASGTDVIPAIPSRDVSRPGTSQFGINLAANTTPSVGDNVNGPGIGNVTANYNTPDRFQFVPGDMLATASAVSDYRKYTVSYIINSAKAQPPGIYISTLTYVCLANF